MQAIAQKMRVLGSVWAVFALVAGFVATCVRSAADLPEKVVVRDDEIDRDLQHLIIGERDDRCLVVAVRLFEDAL